MASSSLLSGEDGRTTGDMDNGGERQKPAPAHTQARRPRRGSPAMALMAGPVEPCQCFHHAGSRRRRKVFVPQWISPPDTW